MGPATIGENLASLREFTAGAAAVFSQELMLRSLSELFSAKSFLWVLFPVPVSYTHLDVYKRQASAMWSC